MEQRERLHNEELDLRRRAETVIAMSEAKAQEAHREAMRSSELAADREGRTAEAVQRIQKEATEV